MDPNTNTPIDPNEPQPLGGPLHPPVPPSPVPPSEPTVVSPTLPAPSDVPPSPQVFAPTPVAPPAASPALGPNPFANPADNVIAPTQPMNQPLPPSSAPFPPAPLPTAGANVLPPPPVGAPLPPSPVVVSGGFAPNAPLAPGAPVVGTVSPAFPATAAPLPPASSSKINRRLKPLLIGLSVFILLIGGSAAAYFGAIVPNQPANVLKTAITNSLEQNSVSYNGTLGLDYLGSGSSANSQNYQLSVSGSRNAADKANDVSLGFNGYGVKLSLEARIVNENLYLKAGDLSTVAALADSLDPTLTPTATALSKDLSNQWVEVDSSTLSAAGASCFINGASGALSQADINLLTSDYAKHGFVNIEKTANTTVGGVAAEEFVVNIDDNKAAGFVSGLGNLSAVKALEGCKDVSTGTVTNSFAKIKGDGKQTALTLWVSKANKQIVQLSYVDSAQNIAKSHTKGSIVMKLNYNNVTIPAPANAESVLQLYTKLQPTLGGLNSAGLNLNSLLSGGSSGVSAAATSLLK